MTQVYQLTEIQAYTIRGQQYTNSSYFSPVKDGDGYWFISAEEVNGCDNADFLWVKDLPAVPYVPPATSALEVLPRNVKIEQLMTYMRNELTPADFAQFIRDTRDLITEYLYFSESLVYWVRTESSPAWGDYSGTGFKTQTTYRGIEIDGDYPRAIAILSILNG